MRMLLATILAAVSLSACKTTDLADGGSAVKDLEEARPKILLIGAGGWRSCDDGNPFKQRIYDSFKNLAKDLSEHADVDFLIACLFNVTPAKNVANLWYSSSDEQVYRIKARDFPFYTKQHITQTRPDQVYVVGHSYGGWVALRLPEAGVPTDAIFTLDPIDARDCLPVDNFFLGLGVESSNCKRFPDMDYSAISANTKRVYNIWQPLGPIHSTPISSGIAANWQLDINHSSFQGLQAEKVTYAHRMIGSDPKAWGIVCQTIFKSNGWPLGGCRTMEGDGSGRFTNFVTVDVPQVDSGIEINQPDPTPQPNPGSQRITCRKNPSTPQGPINWRVSIVKSGSAWRLDARRNHTQLYSETDMTVPSLAQQNTASGLSNFVVPNQTLWLSLRPQAGGYVGRFFTQKFNFDIQDMTCANE